MFRTILILTFLVGAGVPLLAQDWPAVEPITKSFLVDMDSDLVSIDLPVNSKSGTAPYFLACRGGSEGALDPLFVNQGINWVGPFMCILNVGDRVRSEGSRLLRMVPLPGIREVPFPRNSSLGVVASIRSLA